MFVDIFSGFKHAGSKTTWLTSNEKSVLIEDLERSELDGSLDKGSIKSLRLLNTLPGLASAFSCVGHQERLKCGGYLVLRVSRRVAEMLDRNVVDKLWEDGLICFVSKEWQCVSDTADQYVSRVIYTLRFPVGFMDKVCEAIYRYIKDQ